MQYEILSADGKDVSKGILELQGFYTPPTVEHASEDGSVISMTHSDIDNSSKQGSKTSKGSRMKSVLEGGEEGGNDDNDSGDASEESEDSEDEDTLQIHVMAAKGLAKADMMGLSDPYVVVRLDDREIGRTSVLDNTLYPRWDKNGEGEIFSITLPAGQGAYRDNGEDAELKIDVYDSNNTRDDVFLGSAVLGGLALQSLLGFASEKRDAANTTPGGSVGGSVKSGGSANTSVPGGSVGSVAGDDLTIATVSAADGSLVTIERGLSTWFNLGKSAEKSIKENKLAKGAVQLRGSYIGGILSADDGRLVKAKKGKAQTLVSLYVVRAAGLARVASKMAKAGGMFSSKKGGKGDNDAPLAECSSFAVIRWNGVVVGRTLAHKNDYNPGYQEHIMIRVPHTYTVRQCELEVSVHAEAGVMGGDGPFLGSCLVKDKELLQLLSGKFNGDGEFAETVCALGKSPHFPEDDQKLVQGTITLRGARQWQEEAGGGNRRGALTEGVELSHKQLAQLGQDVDISQIKNIRRLEVRVLEGSELATPSSGPVNTYATVSWNGRVKGTTSTVSNSVNPLWGPEDPQCLVPLPLPLDVSLCDCVLELRMYAKSRMGTVSFLGEHKICGLRLEKAAHSQGKPDWFEMAPSRYLDEKGNAHAQGALRISVCLMNENDELTQVTDMRPSEVSWMPPRVELTVQDLSNIPFRTHILKMTLVTNRCLPYVQLLWNGTEAGCTSCLSISYMEMNERMRYKWSDERFCFIIPDDKQLEQCVLQLILWDKSPGLRDSENDSDCFCGQRTITGQELVKFAYKTTNMKLYQNRREAQARGETVAGLDVANEFAMARSWEMDLDRQLCAKGTVGVLGCFVPEKDVSVDSEEEEEEEEGEFDEEGLEGIEEGEEGERGERRQFGEPGTLVKREVLDPVTGEVLVVGDDDPLDNSTFNNTFAYNNLVPSMSEEERQQLVEHELEMYWQQKKQEHEIIIPDGATFHFTKHYDETQGKFYYFDHVSGQTTWDAPAGKVQLYLSDEQIDNIRSEHERKALLAKQKIGEGALNNVRALVLAKMKKEKDIQVKYYQAQKKADAERKNRSIWQVALMDASQSHGELSLSWKPMGYIDPVVFEFKANFGSDLLALRLIGLELHELPKNFGDKLVSLEFLSLSNNELTYLPDSFVNMTRLREINLLHNKLECLPQRIGLMCSLLKLEIANNHLKKLPITFGALNLLERIDLECNHLQVSLSYLFIYFSF